MYTLLGVISLVAAYAIGMFPTGTIIARRKGVDITAHGSKNVGATNVARVLGMKLGVVTLIGDAFKGLFGVALSYLISFDLNYACLAAIMVVYGHCYPIPIRLYGKPMKGGKGVATGLGAMLFISPLVALLCIVLFLILVKFTRIVSIGSMTAALTAPIFVLLLGEPDQHFMALFGIAIIVLIRHKENLQRLIHNEEKRI